MKSKEDIEAKLKELENMKQAIDVDLDDDTPIICASEMLGLKIKLLKWILKDES